MKGSPELTGFISSAPKRATAKAEIPTREVNATAEKVSSEAAPPSRWLRRAAIVAGVGST